MDLSKLNITELLNIQSEVNKLVHNHVDGYLYICYIRSFGSTCVENENNEHSVQESCNEFSGESGVIDVYTNNINIQISNFSGGVNYIESEDDLKNWKKYTNLESYIEDAIKQLDLWEGDGFSSRKPLTSREEIVEYEKELGEIGDFIKPLDLYEDGVKEQLLRKKKLERIIHGKK